MHGAMQPWRDSEVSDCMDLRDAAALLKVSPETLRRKAKLGVVPAWKIGGWRFSRAELMRHLQGARPSTNARRELVGSDAPDQDRGSLSYAEVERRFSDVAKRVMRRRAELSRGASGRAL